MGRVLALSFLGVLFFWAITVVASIGWTVGRIVGADHNPALSPLLMPFQSILAVAVVLFFFVAPISIGILLFAGLLGRSATGLPNGLHLPWTGWKEPRVAVAITAWNDEEAIREAVREFTAEPYVVETIVVDNNSEDATVAVAQQQGARVVIEPQRGYGNVCIRGLHEALNCDAANIVVLVEGDMTFCASDMTKMIPYLEDVDMVVGTRTTYELTDSASQMDWFLSWGNLFLATLIRLRYWDPMYFGKVRLTDVGCTFRVMRKSSLRGIIDQLSVGDDHFSPHMIIEALRARLRIIEVPIKFRKRVGISKGAGGSRTRAMRIGLRMLVEILQ
jgi:hypothetical protein